MIWVYILGDQSLHVAGSAFYEVYLGKSKVENLGMITFSNENVRWFDVSMDYSLGVSRVQPFGYANRYIQQRFQLYGTTSYDVFQSLPFQKFHGNEGFATFLSNVVYRANIRMI